MAENRYSGLMHYVCVGHGYCGGVVDGKPSHVDHYIPDNGPISAEQFAEWVMLADGVGPDDCSSFRKQHKSNIVQAFIRIMGSETVDASELKWEK